MALMVGSARIDENGNVNGGRPGDQTKKEVSTQKYYMSSKGWYCLRAKDVEIATKLANAMYSACSNDMIGYNQYDRNSVIIAQKNFGGLANITLPVNCDCSSLVRACVIQASNIDPGNFNTGNEVSALLRTGLFLNTISVTSGTSLFDGDILVTKTKGHTVIVVSGNPRNNGTKCPYQEPVSVLKIGNRGDGVRWIQWHLVRKNYLEDMSEVDGIFGTKTEIAVKNIQSDSKIEIDGEVGKYTRSVLKK